MRDAGAKQVVVGRRRQVPLEETDEVGLADGGRGGEVVDGDRLAVVLADVVLHDVNDLARGLLVRRGGRRQGCGDECDEFVGGEAGAYDRGGVLLLHIRHQVVEGVPGRRLLKVHGHEGGESHGVGHRVETGPVDVRPEVMPTPRVGMRAVALRRAAVHQERVAASELDDGRALHDLAGPRDAVEDQVALLGVALGHEALMRVELADLAAVEALGKVQGTRCAAQPAALFLHVHRVVEHPAS